MGRAKTGKRELVKQLYESGSSIEEIAKRLGYQISSVKAILSQTGVKRKKMAKDYHEEIAGMVNEGRKVSEIAAKIGLSHATVSTYIHRTGMRSKVFRANPEEPELQDLMFAKERIPIIEKVTCGGKRWEDVTDLYIGQ